VRLSTAILRRNQDPSDIMPSRVWSVRPATFLSPAGRCGGRFSGVFAAVNCVYCHVASCHIAYVAAALADGRETR